MQRYIIESQNIYIEMKEGARRFHIQTLPADAVALIEKQHMQHEKTLSMYSQKGKLTQLSLMEANIDRALLDLYDKNQMSIYQMLADGYEDGYYRAMYKNQQALGFGKDLVALNNRAIEKAVMAKHHKTNYSRTLYEHCKYFSKDMKQNLVTGLILGESMDRMASRMSKRLSVSAATARRLVRTETAYIYEAATMDSYKECGISQYEFMATLDGKTSKICRELDGKVFDVKDAVPGKNYPPMHPNCRSTTVCHLADDKVTERIAKDKRGKYYSVPSDMTYKEWKKAALKTGKSADFTIKAHTPGSNITTERINIYKAAATVPEKVKTAMQGTSVIVGKC